MRCLSSILEPSDVSLHFDARSTEGWFATPLSSLSLSRSLGNQASFVWNRECGESCLVWYDYGLFSDLIGSDAYDDREFQIPKRHKRLLHDELQANFVSRNRHFGDWEEDNPRTSKDDKEQGEDLSTSREEKRWGEDPKTSREPQKRGEDPSTSREQFMQEKLGNLQENLVGMLSGTFHSLADYPSSTAVVDRADKPWKSFKVFSPPRVTPEARLHGLETTQPPAFDRECGWEFLNARDRAEFWQVMRKQKPDLVILTPECKPFSQLMNVNWSKMNESERLRIQTEGMAMLQFCIQVTSG